MRAQTTAAATATATAEERPPVARLGGKWELVEPQGGVAPWLAAGPPALLGKLQDIEVSGHSVRFSGEGASAVSLDLRKRDGPIHAAGEGLEGGPLRLEYACGDAKVIDERRLLRNGTRLEQKLLLVDEKKGPPLVERRYFRRKAEGNMIARALGGLQQPKVRLLLYLLLSQLPLVAVVPPHLWGTVICAFHGIALFLVLFSPRASTEAEAGEAEHKLLPPLQIQRSATMPAKVDTTRERTDVLDVFVSVVSVRKRSRGLTTWSEFELRVAPRDNGKPWSVWRRYAAIEELHGVLEELLESPTSRGSLFTKVVPYIPPRTKGRWRLPRSRRKYDDLLQRRKAGLEALFERTFGGESDLKSRMVVLRDERVQRFLSINGNHVGADR